MSTTTNEPVLSTRKRDRRPLRRAVAVPLLGAALVFGASTPATAGPSNVSVIHGIPGVTVDVYVNGQLTLPAFTPTTVAGPLSLPAANYQVQIFGAVENPPQAAADRVDSAVINESETVPSDQNVSLIANLDNTGTPIVTAFVNDITPTSTGKARVTVRHTANAPTVDIQVNGADAIPGLEYGKEATAELDPGTYDFAAQVSPDGPIAIEIPDVTLTAGTHLIVYAIGDAGAEVPADELGSLQAIGSLAVVTQLIDVGQAAVVVPTVPPAPTPPPAPPVVNPRFAG